MVILRDNAGFKGVSLKRWAVAFIVGASLKKKFIQFIISKDKCRPEACLNAF